MRRTRLMLLDPRRRLRDRLAAAMLVVALLPLGVFTLLVAIDLGAISRSTSDETHQAIVDDQRARLEGQISDRAGAIDSRLAAIARDLSDLHDLLATEAQHPQPVTTPLSAYAGIDYAASADSGTSLLIGTPGTQPGTPQQRAARLADPTGAVVKQMADLRSHYPEIEAVWADDMTGVALRTVPAVDVAAAVDSGRITAAAPQGKAEDAVLAFSQSRMATQSNPDAWPHGARGDGPYWTDPYATRAGGTLGITVWMPVGDGSLRVAADIALKPLTDLVLQGQVSGEPGAYPLILSSSNTVIAATDAASPDFGPAPPAVGTLLPLPRGNPSLLNGITQAEQGGGPGMISTTLSGTGKLLFTADVATPHWILVSAVPAADLEPDLPGLTKGIDQSIHRVFFAAIPIAIVLVFAAFLLAAVMARRMVRPVRALTRAAERLAEGGTDEAVPPQGRDEVGVLAESLERMRREINASRDAIIAASRELEGRVADRTTELRSRNEELVALNELAGSLTRSLEPQHILDGGLEAIRAVLPVIAGRGFVLEGEELQPCAGVGSDDELTLAALDSITGDAISDRHLVTRAAGGTTLIGLPLATSRGLLGGIGVLSAEAPEERTVALLIAIANQVGLALRTAHLSAEGRDTAVLEERTRLAREIHDTLAQQLTGIVLQLEAAEAFVERDPGRASETVTHARELARAALAEARRSVWNLRPEPLTGSGVAAAIGREVERFAERTGIPARLRAAGMQPPPPLQPQAEVALLRIAQQTLTNIADHSDATKVTVRLERRGDDVELTVRDNGCGFDPASARPGSFGIIGMTERARLAGGELRIESTAGRGTTVRVRLPITADVRPTMEVLA